MSAREKIFSAVRRALGNAPSEAARINADAEELLDHDIHLRPPLLANDAVESFALRVSSPKVAASYEHIGTLADLPRAAENYLKSHDLAPNVTLEPRPEIEALDWAGAGISPSNQLDDGVAVSLARWGIAENGTLVFHSGPQSPTLYSFLPRHHIVALPASRILPYLEDYWTAFTALQEGQPRNINLITGASGTTDIEGVLVIGAHGPQNIHIAIIDG